MEIHSKYRLFEMLLINLYFIIVTLKRNVVKYNSKDIFLLKIRHIYQFMNLMKRRPHFYRCNESIDFRFL